MVVTRLRLNFGLVPFWAKSSQVHRSSVVGKNEEETPHMEDREKNHKERYYNKVKTAKTLRTDKLEYKLKTGPGEREKRKEEESEST